MVVVLPAPFGPRKPVTRPGRTVKAQIVDRGDRAEALAEPVHLDHAGAWVSRPG
jgi:hypothetical protein